MEMCTKDNGRIISDMALGNLSQLMEIYIKESIKMIREKGKEKCIIKMGMCTRDSGRTV